MTSPLDKLLAPPQEAIARARAIDLERLRYAIADTLASLREARITADSRPSADNSKTVTKLEASLDLLLNRHPRETT